ncbi:hypothetical protein DEJ49_33615 [Streptomyces venezuelae]|uniref:Uncharacterized protein n=1 Tax=Streptomyces venezuelae TaxID=54571 RepID=A0A5P2CWM8_STRVZ|nr:hypothetical protein [Streptomyces venezuelae]QES45279.1 hypothetical protein DEJ49_33615 [Streptomyces venezuelae]
MTQEPEPLKRLTELATQLIEETKALSGESGKEFAKVSRRMRRTDRTVVLLIGSMLLDVAFTVLMGFGYVRVDGNTDRIDELTHRLDVSQSDTRQKALCPLYQLFRDSKSAAGRKAAPDPKAYDHAFEVIEDGYRVLDCKSFADGDKSWSGPSPKG